MELWLESANCLGPSKGLRNGLERLEKTLERFLLIQWCDYFGNIVGIVCTATVIEDCAILYSLG